MPEVSTSVPARRPRPRWRHWLPIAVVVVVLAVVALAGGFRAAPALGVQTFEVGQAVDLRRWTLVLDRVELVDTDRYDSPSPPTLRLKLTATWTGERSTFGLESGLVGVVVPDGPAPETEASTPVVAGYSSGFDPDVARPVVLEYVWPAGATESTPRTPLPPVVDVVLRDERPSDNFLFSDEWTLTRPVGHVVAPVIDRRAR